MDGKFRYHAAGTPPDIDPDGILTYAHSVRKNQLPVTASKRYKKDRTSGAS